MRLSVLLALVALLSSACTAHVFSPPAGVFAVDTSATLGVDRTSVRLEGFFGGAMFGPDLASVRLTLSRGLLDQLDVVVAPSFTRIARNAGEGEGHVFSVRGGVKYAPTKYFALVGGLGGGSSEAGGFFSPHLGFIAALENDFVVPFVSYGLLLSAPINAQSVRFRVGEDSEALGDKDPDPERVRLTPKLTYGWQSSIGLRIWLNFDPKARVRPSLLCAFGGNTLFDSYGFNQREVYLGGSCAVDVHF